MINPVCLSIFGFTLFYWAVVLAQSGNHQPYLGASGLILVAVAIFI